MLHETRGLFTVTGRIVYEMSLTGHKNNFILKFYLNLPNEHKERNLFEMAR